MRCFITLGCSSGASTLDNKNLIDSIYSRGAHCAIGFLETQYVIISESWLTRFLTASSQGNTVEDSIRIAYEEVADFFNPGTMYCRGDIKQRLSR